MKNLIKTYSILVNILFVFFPLSLILGTTIVNLNILLFITTSFFLYRKEFIKFKIIFFDKIIILLSIYILLILLINILKNNFIIEKYIFYKTFSYYRFIALYFVIRVLTEKKILNLKWFGYTGALLSIFVCLDVVYQFFFGKDIFGQISPSVRHNSGPFGDELIAGGFLQKFSMFTFFIPFFLNINFRKIILIILFYLLGLILSGNRVPMIMFLISIFVYFFLDDNLKKYLLKTIIILFSLIFLILSLNKEVNTHLKNIVINGKILITSFISSDLKQEPLEVWQRPYVTEFYCAKENIKKNFFSGGGLRSYRTFSGGCNTHPHNYYLEVFSDLGLGGFLIFIFIYFFLMTNIVKNYALKNLLNAQFWPYFLILFAELFPLRTNGSIFTTKNSLILFIVFAILANLTTTKKPINS